MSKHIRYTCNKKACPNFEQDCKRCSEYDPCAKGGKYCWVGAIYAEHDPMMADTQSPIIENAAAPVMRDVSTVTINLGNGMKVDVLREDIQEQLKRDLLSHLNLPGVMYGA